MDSSDATQQNAAPQNAAPENAATNESSGTTPVPKRKAPWKLKQRLKEGEGFEKIYQSEETLFSRRPERAPYHGKHLSPTLARGHVYGFH